MSNDYRRIEQAIRYLRQNAQQQPELATVAAHVGLSPFHFQRLFRKWAGVSPKRYLEFLTVEQGKRLLVGSRSIMQASYDLGLSSPSRLHEQFVSVQAVTPGEFKNQGEGLEIGYGVYGGPFGDMLIAQSHRGVCFLSFVRAPGEAGPAQVPSFEAEFDRLKSIYPRAQLKPDDESVALTARRIFQTSQAEHGRIPLAIKGTNFQVNVWQALLRIPAGVVISYRQLAQAVERPEAVRAVANAVAANPVNVFIPCHRVLRANGDIGGYRGGAQIKQELLAWERFATEP